MALMLIASGSACGDDSGSTNSESEDSGTPDSGALDSEAGTDAGEEDEDPEACKAGTWDHDGDAATACAPWSDCAVGSYVGAAGTASADRICAPCVSGTFSSEANAESCAAWSDCSAGTYASAAPSASSDRSCTTCIEGTYSSLPNSTVCVALSTCTAGTRQVVQGSAGSSDVECTPCEAGTFCAGGSAAPIVCASDTWDDDASAASICMARTQCAPGFKVTSDGSATTDRVCEPCAEGSFSTETNAASCNAWTQCAAGQHVSVAGSAATDRTCSACDSGTFSTGPNASTCIEWTTCTAGQFVAADGTAIADQTCTACAEGTYSSQPNSASCAAEGSCAAGFVQAAPGTATTPVECAPCSAGTFCAGGTAAKVDCTTGSWDHDGSAASPCVAWSDCSAGQYESAAGSATTDRACLGCDVGTFSTTPNASSCTSFKDCVAGEHQAAAGTAQTDRVCAACESGKFSTATNALSCSSWTDCVPGQFIDAVGSASADQSCAACDVGQFSATLNASECSAAGTCAAGTYLSQPASSIVDVVCDDCKIGTYCAGGNAEPDDCAPGTWDHDNNPANVCIAWSSAECDAPAEFLQQQGSATADHLCGTCAAGSVSTESDATSCIAVRSCAEIKNAVSSAPNGVYSIDVDGAGALVPLEVYCDMSTDGGGWTLLLDSNKLGPDFLTPSTPGTDVVNLNTASYLPLAYMKALAELSQQVHLRTVDDLESSFTTVADSEPIRRLRAGVSLSGFASHLGSGLGDFYIQSQYTGPFGTNSHLWWDCAEAQPWPSVYHACDNQEGLHLMRDQSAWRYEQDPDALALFVR